MLTTIFTRIVMLPIFLSCVFSTVLFVSGQQTGELLGQGLALANLGIQEIHLLQIERVFPNQETPIESAECIIQCLQQMGDVQNVGMQDVRSVENRVGKWVEEPFDLFSFQLVCGTYTHKKQCLQSCPESAGKQMTLRSLKPLDYVCVDHYDEFVDAMPCFTKIKDEARSTCEQSCGNINQVFTEMQNVQNEQDRDLKRKTRKQLGVVCDYASCLNSCYRPLLESSCAQHQTELIDRFSTDSIAEILEEFNQQGLQDFLPSNCQYQVANLEENERKIDATTPTELLNATPTPEIHVVKVSEVGVFRLYSGVQYKAHSMALMGAVLALFAVTFVVVAVFVAMRFRRVKPEVNVVWNGFVGAPKTEAAVQPTAYFVPNKVNNADERLQVAF